MNKSEPKHILIDRCCLAYFWLYHLTLISDMSEALILESSFDWTIAIGLIKNFYSAVC